MRLRGALFESALPYLMLAVAVFFWAGNWVMGRALRFDAPPVAMAFWRWAIALGVLLPVTLPGLRRNFPRILSHWKILVLLGVLAAVTQHIPIYIGLRYTTATNGALLNATSPILIALLAWMLVRDPIGILGAVGIAISLAGVLWILTQGNPAAFLDLSLNVGDLWVLLGTLSWAGYTVCLRWRPKQISPLEFLTILSAVGVAGMAPLYALEIASGSALTLNTGSVLGILYMGLLASVAAYILWNGGVEKIGAGKAGPFMYLMPVFTPALSIAFLGESLHMFHILGVSLIFTGIYLTSRPRRKEAISLLKTGAMD